MYRQSNSLFLYLGNKTLVPCLIAELNIGTSSGSYELTNECYRTQMSTNISLYIFMLFGYVDFKRNKHRLRAWTHTLTDK